jgi:uncharacterized membrane protein
MTVTRGAVRVRGLSPRGRPLEAGGKPANPLTVQVAGLVALAVLTPLHASWAVQLLMVPVLLIVPGVVLLRALRVPGAAIAACPVYVPAASILVLMGSGLAIDLIGPVVGIPAPLRAAPLLITLEVVCIGLLLSARSASPETQIPWGALQRPVALMWPLILPLVGAAGALRLNSGHSNAVALIAIALVVITLIAAFLRAPWQGDALLIVILFAAGLALMWSFSLRGDLVYGFDISSEYYSLNQTVTAGVWHVSHPNDAYGAMLSLTVLPAVLHELSGVPTLFIFKVVYPAIVALFPVGVFCLGRRFITGRWAFMAAALVIMQQTFFEQMPALARQEIGTLFFAALLAVLLDTTESKRSPGRWVLVCLLSSGMVVSHYSTTYLAIPLFALAAAFQWIFSWFRPIPRMSGALLLAFGVSLVGAILWYGPITHSASNLSQFEQSADAKGVGLLPNKGGNALSTYLQGEESQELSPAQYQVYIKKYYQTTYPFVTPLPTAGDPQYDLKVASDSVPPVKIESLSSGLNLVDLLVQQATNLLAGITVLVLAFRRKASAAARQIALMGLAGVALLIVVRISGTIAVAYNPTRAFMQLLIVLAIPISWFFQRLGAQLRWARPWILIASSASLGAFIIGATGFSDAFLGGGTDSNLANSYADYQHFVATTQDLAAGAWVLRAAPPDQVIETDRYGELRLVTMAGQRPGMFGDITPGTTDQHAWVYATRANIIDNIVQSETGNYTASYAFPKLFLESNFNVVYTNGTSEVFHR